MSEYACQNVSLCETVYPLSRARKYISFILAHYSLRNCFSSIILTTWILRVPDSLGEAPASLQTPFFLETSLSSIMSFLGGTFYLGLFLCLPLEAGCQHTTYNTDHEALKYTWFTGLSLKGNAWLCRLHRWVCTTCPVLM